VDERDLIQEATDMLVAELARLRRLEEEGFNVRVLIAETQENLDMVLGEIGKEE